MFRLQMLMSAVLGAAVLVGCDRAADDEAKAQKAQAVANDKITSATIEVGQKIATAQAEADKAIAEAQADFMRRRESYRHDVSDALTKLDERIAKLAANERVASGNDKAQLDARLPQIRASRDMVNADYGALEAASAVTWDAAKARLEDDMKTLRAAVEGS